MKPAIRKTGYLGIAIALMFSLGLGCASKEEKKAKHWQRAKQYVAKKEFKKAVIELKNVVQLDPRDDQAYFELGETHLKLKQGNEAFQAFSRAASLNPNNLKAQLKVGQILLLANKPDEARKKAELILEKSPDNVEALTLLSGIQLQKKETESAIKTLQKVASIKPDHFRTYLSLGRLYFLKGDLNQAERTYLKAISLSPESKVPYAELANIYLRRGQWDKAESKLKEMIQASRSKYQDLGMLARFYESTDKIDKAKKTYLEAVKLAPEGDVVPLVNLGGFYARTKDYENALKTLQKAAEKKKGDLDILTEIAQLHFDFKKFQDAEKTVDDVLSKDKGHPGANFLKGRLDLVKRRYDEGVRRFDTVIRDQPENGMAHYYKALCLLGKNERGLAEQDLVKAVDSLPWLLQARLLLAESYMRDGSRKLAREQVDRVLKVDSTNLKALSLKGTLDLMDKKVKEAEKTFKKIVELKPAYAPGFVQLGLFYDRTKQRPEALKAYKKALELDPKQVTALGFIVNAYVREKKFDKALGLCKKQEAKVSGAPSTLARIQYLKGSIFAAKKDPASARTYFQKAIDTDPNLMAPYLALARTYVQEKKLPEAISQYEGILKKNPNYLPGYMALGTIYEKQGNTAEAEASYRKALEIKSDFAPAANNLAWSLAQRGANIDEALGLAQTAKENMPDSAAVMDTLGWIYYLKGSYLNAIAEFRDSLHKIPDNPEVNYHLGLAYYKTNRLNEAREYLEKALKINDSFKGAEEAKKILNEIRTSAKTG